MSGRPKKKSKKEIEADTERELREDPVRGVSLSNFLLDSMANFETFSSRFLKIQTKFGDLVDFETNEVQGLIEKIIDDIRSKDRLVRLVILKARRKGISTWVSGRFFWKTITKRNHYSMIITHEPEATDFIFKMHKRFLDHIPSYLRPEERYNNKRTLEFNTPDGSGLDSAIRVGTAGKEDFGSGQLIHNLHLSELAKYPTHTCSSLLLSLLQCVPKHPDTEIIMESTAKGVGGEFYDRYWGSKYRYDFYLDEQGEIAYKETINESAPEENIYCSLFIPWFVFKEYRMEPKYRLDYTDDEKELIRLYGIKDDQLTWRRWCIENNCNGDINLFNQEYPADAMSAFISSSDNIFSVQQITDRLKLCKPPISLYNVNLNTGVFHSDIKGRLKVWEEPKLGREYLISADIAEGIVGRDFTSADVIDLATGKQVAHYHTIIAPDQAAFVLYFLGKRYGNALIAVERNNHGLGVIDKLTDMGYNNQYAETIIEPPARPRKRYGWLTTKVTKPAIIDNLVSEFRNNIDGINCAETLDEMMFFKQHEDLTLGAEEGHKDDRVISYAIGKYIRSKQPLIKKRTRLATTTLNHYNKANATNNKKISSASWA